MKLHISGTVSLVLVLMAASSLVSMISTLKIDGIVHGDLYRYGLQFSYDWAMPYWTMTTIVFGMGWFNIIAAIAFQFYVLLFGRKEAMKPETLEEQQLQPTIEETPQIEAKPIEKVEEYKEQATEPAEIEKEPQETQTVVEDTSQQEQSETTQVVEVKQQEEQESKPVEASETETNETSTPATETEQETAEKSEETPVQVGVPQEESQTTTEETLSQTGTSPL